MQSVWEQCTLAQLLMLSPLMIYKTLLGRWIKKRGNRPSLFITSKVGFPVPADGVGMSVLILIKCEDMTPLSPLSIGDRLKRKLL